MKKLALLLSLLMVITVSSAFQPAPARADSTTTICPAILSLTASGAYGDPAFAYDCKGPQENPYGWNAGAWQGWITAQFTSPLTFSGVLLTVGSNPGWNGPNTEVYDLSGSNDGTSFTPITTPTTVNFADWNPIDVPIAFAPVTYSYLRIDVNGGASWVYIYEVRLTVANTPANATQAVLGPLGALGPVSKDADKKVADAISHLTKSLDPALWADDSHLVPKDGKKVFDEDKAAVHALEGIKNPTPALAAQLDGWIAQLEAADQTLALTAINAQVDPAKKAAALKEYGQALAEQAKGHTDAAFDHFRNAWDKATGH